MSSLGPFSVKTLGRFALLAAAWPFLAALGAIVTAAGAWRFAAKLLRATRARRSELVCPRGHANDVIGRWACDRCGGEFLGWVGACEICGDESADWVSCERCALAITLPWKSRS